MSIITISHSVFGGGRELAERVGSILDCPCISREVLIEASKLYGVPEAKYSEVLETEPHWWQRWGESLRLYRITLQAAMCELAQDGKMVYHGQGGQELFQGVRHVLKVLVCAPIGYRLEQVKARKELSEAAAEQLLGDLDRIRTRRMKAIFGVDWRDPARYDLVLNISQMSLETAAHLVVEASQRQEYQPTAESMEAFADLTITARVQAALAVSPESRHLDIGVTSAQGEVHLSGILREPGLDEKIIRLVQGIPGVVRVVPDFITTYGRFAPSQLGGY